MKKLILILIMITLGFSNEFHKPEEMSILQKKIPYEALKKLHENFIVLTGENKENVNRELKTYWEKDMNFLRAINLYFKETKVATINYYDPTVGQDYKFRTKLPEYKKSLDELQISASNGNVYAAFFGAYMIDNFLSLDMSHKEKDFSNDLFKNKYELFLRVMNTRHYCYSKLMTINYYEKTKKGTLEIKEIESIDLKKCQTSPEFVQKQLRVKKSKLEAFKKYREKKGLEKLK